jgi:predicted AlkP superfamily phosphohydrolase/phosphomutase
VHFRLFALAPDGSQILLYRTAPQAIRSSRARLEPFAFEATGGFVGNGAAHVYERGELGPPIWEGGDGTAEKRYLETVALVTRQITRLTDFALEKTAWDLLLTYLPYPDGALHLWLGRLDPGLPGHDAALASRLWPYMDQVLGAADGYVGHLLEKAGQNTIVAVGADHGMEGVARLVRPNIALAAAGIVVLDETGQVDVARSLAVYFRGNSGYVLVNRAGREGGVVPAGEEEAVRRRVKAALKAIRDPATGKAVVLDVWDARTTDEPATGGSTGGDLYLSLAPGYELTAQLKGALVESEKPKGAHGQNPDRPGMHASFIVGGPGVSAGVALGVIRQIDIAPTLCALLGIDPPAQARGRVLSKVLAWALPTPSRGRQ